MRYNIHIRLSYKEDYVTDGMCEKDLPNIYLSTLVLHPDARNRGLTKNYMHIYLMKCMLTETSLPVPGQLMCRTLRF